MRFVQSLEHIPGPAGVLGVWRHHLQDEMKFVMPFLNPEPELASSVECAAGQLLRIVEIDEGEFEAVCDDTREAVSINREDIVIYNLSLPRLSEAIATSLGLRMPATFQLGAARTMLLGNVCLDHKHFPAFLLMSPGGRQLHAQYDHLCSCMDGHFVIVVPTQTHLEPQWMATVKGRGHAVVDLESVIQWQCPGHFTSQGSFAAAVRRSQTRGASKPEKANVVHQFESPLGTSWKDVLIRFIDDDTIEMTVAEVTKRLTLAQAGFANNRSKAGRTPTLQWELLQRFATALGNEFTWAHPEAARKWQPQKHSLDRRLRDLSGIHTTAFENIHSGWKPSFTLEWHDPAVVELQRPLSSRRPR